MGKNIGKNVSKNISGKYCHKPLDHAKQFAADALETNSKRAIQRTAEAFGDFIWNEITNKISKTSLHRKIQKQLQMNKKHLDKDIYPQKKAANC